MSALCPQLGSNSPESAPRAKRRLAPFSRKPPLGKIDLRTRAARLMKAVRAELVAHVGGSPSAPQAAIIEQLVQLKLRLATLDRRFTESGDLTPENAQTYLALSDSHARLLEQLGQGAHGQPVPPSKNGHTAPNTLSPGRAEASLGRQLSSALARRAGATVTDPEQQSATPAGHNGR